MHTFEDLKLIVHEIRNKCPWDKEQSHESLKKYLIEESYEVLEAIDDKNMDDLSEELGDVLLQIMLHSELADEKKAFAIDSVIDKISEKMIRRHPHVFEKRDENLSSEEVLINWEAQKKKEKNRESILDGVPKQLPALIRAQRLQSRASKVGMDWSDSQLIFNKIKEEIIELEEEIEANNQKDIKKELGDVIFSLVNFGRHLNIDVEDALQQTNKKFISRISYIESQFDSIDSIKNTGLEDLDKLWDEAKAKELE